MRIKYIIAFLTFTAFFSYSFAQDKEAQLHIIPQPVSVSRDTGHFTLHPDTKIRYNRDATKQVAELFTKRINTATGFHLKAQSGDKRLNNSIVLQTISIYDSTLGKAGYILKVTPERVVISANKTRGLFYGVQTLKQLFPPQMEGNAPVKGIAWTAPAVHIMDYPKYEWRGLMLDVSRHFFTTEEVKQYIDEMAKYKYNVFHWHLTDDQGWRIEIKGLPKLTEIGSRRVARTGSWKTIPPPRPEDTAYEGGYYSQKEIKEIVNYARQRFVTILPEIDVPGHSLALIASYPNLSCTQKQYPVYPKYAPDSLDNVLCVANDSTWLILDKIFTQVAALFPSEYIHVGGDEANRTFWMKDPKDLALMKREGLTTPAELQSYFEKKLEKLILAKGKKMIGWDEILEGGVAPEATIMSWRGTGAKGALKATNLGHHVVITPYRHNYFSQLQGDPLVEPEGPGMTRLKEAYEADIFPEGANQQLILGGQACLWTEYVPNYRHAEYMTWPRALATAEKFWGTTTDFNDFTRRVVKQFDYLDAAHVKYARSIMDPIISAIRKKDTLKVVLSTEMPGLQLYYRFDGTNPDTFSPIYKGQPVAVPDGATEIRVAAYKNEEQAGLQINCPIHVLEKRIQK